MNTRLLSLSYGNDATVNSIVYNKNKRHRQKRSVTRTDVTYFVCSYLGRRCIIKCVRGFPNWKKQADEKRLENGLDWKGRGKGRGRVGGVQYRWGCHGRGCVRQFVHLVSLVYDGNTMSKHWCFQAWKTPPITFVAVQNIGEIPLISSLSYSHSNPFLLITG